MTCSQSHVMPKGVIGGQRVKALLVRYHYIPFMGICSNLLYSALCSFHNVPACHNLSCEIFHNLLDNTVFKGTFYFFFFYYYFFFWQVVFQEFQGLFRKERLQCYIVWRNPLQKVWCVFKDDYLLTSMSASRRSCQGCAVKHLKNCLVYVWKIILILF